MYAEEQLTAANSYAQYSKYAEWDGTGDFLISYTGEILIYGVSLFNDKLADAKIYLEGKITQTAEALTSKYDKIIYTSDGKTLVWDSLFKQTADSISAQVERIDKINNTVETAGWVTKASGNELWASKTVESGDGIIETINSYIKQTPEHITISASAINLVGAVTFSMLAPGLASDTEDKDGNPVKSLLALRTDLPDLSEYEKAGAAEAIRNAIVTGNTEILGGYINTKLINTSTLIVNDGAKIGGFLIDDDQITSKDSANKQLMAINPLGGIYFSTADIKRQANFGIVSVDPLSGISALSFLGQYKTDEIGQCGMIIRCDSNYGTRNLLLTYSTEGSYRECSIGFRNYTGDDSWFKRLCMNVTSMPFENHLKNTSGIGSPKGHAVYWDENSGLFYVVP